jgi:hypothetical protein
MKKIIGIALLGYSFLSAAESERKTEKTSISHLFVRPVHDNLTARNNYWHDSFLDVDKKNAFQILTQYHRSFGSDDMRRHFLMANRNSLKVRGSTHADFASVTNPEEIRADWIGLPTGFQGTLNINPKLWQLSIMVSARHSFDKLFGLDFFENWFGFINMPLVIAHTDMNFTQDGVTAAATTGEVRDILTAFNNSTWKYQKIRTDNKTSTNIGEIRLGLGRTLLSTGRATAATYSAISIPATKKPSNEYIFEPQVGFNGHVGIIFGANLELPLTREESEDQTMLFLDFENNSLIRNKQYRTFDLKNKQWSRFLEYRKNGFTAEQGVNIMTRKTRCSPYSITQASTGIRFTHNKVEGQVGFGVWGHGAERLVLDTAWEEEYGIAGTTITTSATVSTIKTLGADDAAFTTVKKEDIDLNSAASPATVAFSAHASLGGRGRGENADGFWGIGASAEIPRGSTKAFKTIGFWATAGGAF